MLNFDGHDADDDDEEEGGAPKPAAKVYTISQAAPEEPATSAQGPHGQVYFSHSDFCILQYHHSFSQNEKRRR